LFAYHCVILLDVPSIAQCQSGPTGVITSKLNIHGVVTLSKFSFADEKQNVSMRMANDEVFKKKSSKI